MTFPDPAPQQRRSSFEAWADSDGCIELLPLMVQVRATSLIIDCTVASARFSPPEPVRDLGHPAVLSLECSPESIDRAHDAIWRLMMRNGTFQLLHDDDGGLLVLQAEAEIWMLQPIPV